MPPGRLPTGARSGPSAEIDLALDEFEALSRSLVLLDERSFPELAAEVDRFERALRDHLGAPPDVDGQADPERLERDHRRFLDSLEVLDWLTEIVRNDDHGGNRQALGQYGRLVTEALRHHRERERSRTAERTVGPRTTSGQP